MTVPKLLRNWQGTYAGGPARTQALNRSRNRGIWPWTVSKQLARRASQPDRNISIHTCWHAYSRIPGTRMVAYLRKPGVLMTAYAALFVLPGPWLGLHGPSGYVVHPHTTRNLPQIVRAAFLAWRADLTRPDHDLQCRWLRPRDRGHRGRHCRSAARRRARGALLAPCSASARLLWHPDPSGFQGPQSPSARIAAVPPCRPQPTADGRACPAGQGCPDLLGAL